MHFKIKTLFVKILVILATRFANKYLYPKHTRNGYNENLKNIFKEPFLARHRKVPLLFLDNSFSFT